MNETPKPKERPKEQRGQVYAEGSWWYLRYRDARVVDGVLVRKRVRKRLGPVEGMTPEAAREEADDVMRDVQKSEIEPENSYTLVDFAEKVYFPAKEATLRPSALRGYRIVWRDQIKPFVKDLWTKDTRTRHVQKALNLMARCVDDDGRERFGINMVKRAKSILHGIFKLAAQQGYYPEDKINPVKNCYLPKARSEEETHAYSLTEVERMISLLPEPAATIVATAAYTGVRRSELAGLRWENYNGKEIYIRISRWNGIETEPKTKKSKAPIPIIKPLAARLEFHRARLGDPSTGPMWPNAEGQPRCLNNLLERVILRTLNRCVTCHKSEAEHVKHPAKVMFDHKYERDSSVGVAWHGWHAFRRGLSTTLHELGVPAETIQKIMRHEDVSTTQKHYIKVTGEAEKAAMGQLEAALLDRKLGQKTARSRRSGPAMMPEGFSTTASYLHSGQ